MKIKDILTDNGLPNWDVIKTINQFGDMKSTPQSE